MQTTPKGATVNRPDSFETIHARQQRRIHLTLFTFLAVLAMAVVMTVSSAATSFASVHLGTGQTAAASAPAITATLDGLG